MKLSSLKNKLMIPSHVRAYRLLFPVVLFAAVIVLSRCSTEKTGWAHRTYHNINARFNGYFNAREKVKESMATFEEAYEEDYTRLLPVFIQTNEQSAQTVLPDMDIAIEKCSKVINRHSIEKRNDEYVKWIDECYFVIGQANYHKMEFAQAKQFFEFVSKKYKDQETKYDAMVWLAKTYIRQENYMKAERILRLAEGDEGFPERLLPEMRKVYADLYIQQENYPLALPELKLATQIATNKKDRTRLTFLLGQLYAEQGELQNASMAYKRVIAMHPDYKMTFYAKIQLALSYNTEYGGRDEIRKELRKMLADEKYIEFRDQIYYGLAMMDEQEGNIPATLENLQNSVDASINNNNQKGRSFLKMGEIHFEQKKYRPAQAYYDSCTSFLSPEYPGYEDIVRIAQNLEDLVTQILIIEEQDSLLRVARMPENERDKLIAEIIQNKLEEQEREEAEFESAQFAESQNDPFGSGGGGAPGIGGPPQPGGNKWYFYNPATVGFGAGEFRKIWGSRRNEDNWRRSDKSQLDPIEIEETFDDTGTLDFIVDNTGDTIQLSNDWEDPSYWLKDLPFTDEQQTAAEDIIIDAYRALAIVYKEQMLDLPEAIHTLDTMNQRFAPHKYQADVYYRLYRMHTELMNDSKAEYYKNLILKEYPESDFAKILIDPEYFSKASETEQAATEYYNTTYGYYNREYFYQTIKNCDIAFQRFPESELIPKFKLLRALATGQEEGRESLIANLKALAKEYEGEEVGEKASQLLAVLEKPEEQPQEEEEKEEEEPSPYTYEPNTKHNFVVLLPQNKGSMLVMKNSISSYNQNNYRMEGLKSRNTILKADTHMVAVQSFNDAQRGLTYLNNFNNNESELKFINDNQFPRFIISYNNYAIFYQRKDVAEYMEFFQKHYLEGK